MLWLVGVYTHSHTGALVKVWSHFCDTIFKLRRADRSTVMPTHTKIRTFYHWSVWFTFSLQPYVLSPHLLPLPCYPGLPRDVAYQLAESDRSFDAETVRLSVCVLFDLASSFPSSFQPLWTSCNKQAHWQKWRKLKREEWGNRYNRRLKVWEEKEVRQRIMFYCAESESVNASRLKALLWSERWQIMDGWVNGQMNID